MSELDNVDHLKSRAAADLAKPYTGVSLDWAMRAAHFTGQLEAVRGRLTFVEIMFRDLKSAVGSRYAPDALDPRSIDAVQELAGLQAIIGKARHEVALYAELLRAAELTSALIDRRLSRTPQLRLVESTAMEGNGNG